MAAFNASQGQKKVICTLEAKVMLHALVFMQIKFLQQEKVEFV